MKNGIHSNSDYLKLNPINGNNGKRSQSDEYKNKDNNGDLDSNKDGNGSNNENNKNLNGNYNEHNIYYINNINSTNDNNDNNDNDIDGTNGFPDHINLKEFKTLKSESEYAGLRGQAIDYESDVNKAYDNVYFPIMQSDTKRDPLLVLKRSLQVDFFSLTWITLRKSTWKYNIKKIQSCPVKILDNNVRLLKLYFFTLNFITLTILSIFVFDAFTTRIYKNTHWNVTIFRIIIMFFTQKLFEPKISQATSLLIYTLKHPGKFSENCFALLVPITQIFLICIFYIVTLLISCIANSALLLVFQFVEIFILAKVDQWIGQSIVKTKMNKMTNEVEIVYVPNSPSRATSLTPTFNLELINTINERMTLIQKMSLIDYDDLNVTNDLNFYAFESTFFQLVSNIFSNIPWILLPFLTLPVNYLINNIYNV